MEKVKKLWKDISVFGVVVVVFLVLLGYRKLTHVELTTLTTSALESKLKDKDDFVVVVGSDSDTATTSYQEVCTKYLKNHRGDTLYYVNLGDNEDYASYIQKTFDTSDGSIPSTFKIVDGKVDKQKTGSISYYRLAQLFE